MNWQKTPKHNKMNYYSISEVKQVETPTHDILPIIGKRNEKLPEFTRDQVKMLHYLPTGSVLVNTLRPYIPTSIFVSIFVGCKTRRSRFR